MMKSLVGEDDFAPLLRTLQRTIAIDPQERQDLLAAFETPRTFVKGGLLAGGARGDDSVTVLLEGLAYSSRAAASGRAQTIAVHTPGDLLNLQSFLLGSEPLTTFALTAGRAATISHGRLKRLLQDHPRLAHALWGGTVADGLIAQEWIFGLGSRSALQNLAHFICELQVRLERATGQVGGGFAFPLTQEQVGETLGLSVVHVNRTLQQLRSAELLRLSRSTLTILDAEGLKALAGFDPAYLQPAAWALLQPLERPSQDRSRDDYADGAAAV